MEGQQDIARTQRYHLSMKPLYFRLTLDVTINPQGVDADTLSHRLKQIVKDAVARGTVTGETPATVLRYSYAVQQTNGSHTIPPLDRQ